MSELKLIIEAIKSLDFDKLNILLDDNKSYMGVSKSKFLNALQKEAQHYEGLEKFDSVEIGICNSCNKGCKAYKFKAKDQPSICS